ncbi:MAG: Stp1/IreP family PP2C-type Ser/Thr phosphatase [Clostridia bacterium]|nr:Stp1/IreP family PP2C-type Ser/Thr phosphatase [Clostridia bacterium]
MKAWGLTDIGNVREVNQDTFRMEYDAGAGRGLFLVCDGMGGAKAGEVASGLAADAFVNSMSNSWKEGRRPDTLKDLLLEAYSQVNEVVYDASRANEDYAGMGTTMVAAVCGEGQALIGNVGDSRAYLLDDSGMRQITEDHSLVTELMKRGDLTSYQASRHPSRNVITRAMGADATVKCDTFLETLKPGQFLLLCSDGLIREVTEPEIYYEIYQAEHPETACARLLDMAKSRGGRDNITMILIAY